MVGRASDMQQRKSSLLALLLLQLALDRYRRRHVNIDVCGRAENTDAPESDDSHFESRVFVNRLAT